ncbi:MAG: tetratricopeptide repeat protein [Treponema sp.]|jgi:tetratricopeptide (TPR) repeat protein|nr:tetratricopeptide repeat protein [Treponema sp.]
MQNNSGNESTGNKVNDFIQKNRKSVFMVLGIVVFLLIGAVVVLSVKDALHKKAIVKIEELSGRYEELRFMIGEESSDSDVDALLADLQAFAKNKSGFAGGKAWSLIAQIHGTRSEWPQAEDAWRSAAEAASKTYLGPAAFFNAAVAAEEQGKREQAIEFYGKCVSLPVEFPQAPRAQFAIGRLYEELDDFPAAIEAYREILTKWPNINTWVNLARSRVIALETR